MSQATIADISQVANVARGALHYYFKDKEDLVTRALHTVPTQYGTILLLKD